METITIGTGPDALEVPRIITGLWQLDQGGADLAAAPRTMGALAEAGLAAFDTADIYGPAEKVVGAFRQGGGKCVSLTKWCPDPAISGPEACAAAVEEATSRLGGVDLLQFHIWTYDRTSYIDNLYHLTALRDAGKFKQLGLTNVDISHLDLLLGCGIPIVSNQVHASVLDDRAEDMGRYCAERGVAVLTYGALLGGFIHPKWYSVGRPDIEDLSPSMRKYLRLIDATGGWRVFQSVLATLAIVAAKYDTAIPAVAIRYVLDMPGVSATIVGSSLREPRIHDHLSVFKFRLDDTDRTMIRAARTGNWTPVAGGCGDEMRYPPFITPTGGPNPRVPAPQDISIEIARGARIEYMSESKWEPVCGMCRAVRYDDGIVVSGTTTRPHPSGNGVIGQTAAQQAVYIFDIIRAAITALGGSMGDVLRTRILFTNVERDWKEVGEVQARVFAPFGMRPANTMVGGLTYVVGPEALLEIEAEAVVGAERETVRIGPGAQY